MSSPVWVSTARERCSAKGSASSLHVCRVTSFSGGIPSSLCWLPMTDTFLQQRSRNLFGLMAVPLQIRVAKHSAAQHTSTVMPTKEYRRMWLLCCVFIICVSLAMLGNLSGTLDLCHSRQSAGSSQQQAPEHIAEQQLQVESSQAQPSNTKSLSARMNKVAICTSIKSEQPLDLEEWVQYYQCATVVPS